MNSNHYICALEAQKTLKNQVLARKRRFWVEILRFKRLVGISWSLERRSRVDYDSSRGLIERIFVSGLSIAEFRYWILEMMCFQLTLKEQNLWWTHLRVFLPRWWQVLMISPLSSVRNNELLRLRVTSRKWEWYHSTGNTTFRNYEKWTTKRNPKYGFQATESDAGGGGANKPRRRWVIATLDLLESAVDNRKVGHLDPRSNEVLDKLFLRFPHFWTFTRLYLFSATVEQTVTKKADYRQRETLARPNIESLEWSFERKSGGW